MKGKTWEKLTSVLVKLLWAKMPREGDTVLGLNAEKLTRLGGVYVRVDPWGGLLGEINAEVLEYLVFVVKDEAGESEFWSSD